MTEYDSEIDPAKALFWHNITEAMKHTTKTEILRELQEIKQDAHKSVAVLKRLGGWLKFGGSQMEEEYPSKRK